MVRYEETRAGTEPRYRYGELIKAVCPVIRHKHAKVPLPRTPGRRRRRRPWPTRIACARRRAQVRVGGVSALGALMMLGTKAIPPPPLPPSPPFRFRFLTRIWHCRYRDRRQACHRDPCSP